MPIESSIRNLTVVDEQVWRGGAPGSEGLADLADHGVTTIVDLRAEDDVSADEELLADLGLTRFHLPVRDGQLPTAEQAARFVEIVEAVRRDRVRALRRRRRSHRSDGRPLPDDDRSEPPARRRSAGTSRSGHRPSSRSSLRPGPAEVTTSARGRSSRVSAGCSTRRVASGTTSPDHATASGHASR